MADQIDSIESDLKSVKNKLDRIETRLNKLEQRTKEDDDTITKVVFNLKQELEQTQEKVAKLQEQVNQ